METCPKYNNATVPFYTNLSQFEELKKWTEYRVWMLAGTIVGDGPSSYPVLVRTGEDGMTEYILQKKEPHQTFFEKIENFQFFTLNMIKDFLCLVLKILDLIF